MMTAIKKFIEHIDQLVCWLKENPATPLPTQEKNRAIAILNKINTAAELSDEEWEKLKPKQQPIHHYPNINFWTNLKRAINPSTKTVIKKSSAVRRTIPLPLSPPKKEIHADNVVNNHGKKMVICPDCKSPVLPKNLLRHKKKCKPPKQKNKNRNQTATKNNSLTNATTQKNIDYKEERRLDGSYGFHQFRENGRFGSHPSFDNMGDDAHP